MKVKLFTGPDGDAANIEVSANRWMAEHPNILVDKREVIVTATYQRLGEFYSPFVHITIVLWYEELEPVGGMRA